MIRPYNDSDYTQVKEILKQGFLTYVSTEFEISPKDVNDFDFTPKMKFLSKDNVTTWVLDTGNEVVGFVSIRPYQEGMELLKIYVAKGSQKKGYGRVLLSMS
jgi:L-amino acid N-acyltransferase YncA